jgi:hypothetical protein
VTIANPVAHLRDVAMPQAAAAIIGRSLRAWTLPAQKTEAKVACLVLNRMTRLGMPVSQRTA